jgi:hypothetical protein
MDLERDDDSTESHRAPEQSFQVAAPQKAIRETVAKSRELEREGIT